MAPESGRSPGGDSYARISMSGTSYRPDGPWVRTVHEPGAALGGARGRPAEGNGDGSACRARQ
jgi:hypothetical protein